MPNQVNKINSAPLKDLIENQAEINIPKIFKQQAILIQTIKQNKLNEEDLIQCIDALNLINHILTQFYNHKLIQKYFDWGYAYTLSNIYGVDSELIESIKNYFNIINMINNQQIQTIIDHFLNTYLKTDDDKEDFQTSSYSIYEITQDQSIKIHTMESWNQNHVRELLNNHNQFPYKGITPALTLLYNTKALQTQIKQISQTQLSLQTPKYQKLYQQLKQNAKFEI